MTKWDIEPLETKKHNLPKTKGMELEVICNYPSAQLFIGQTGSGKSNLLANMVTNPELMGNFFDEIYLISPTAKADDLVKHLKIPESRIWDDLKKAVPALEILLENQAVDIENEGIEAVAKDRKKLLIFDDVIGDRKFMAADILTKLAIHARHQLCSTIICAQSYTRVPRVIRLQMQGLALFPSNDDEVKIIARDYCPPGLKQKEFQTLINFATDERYSFMYINKHASEKKECFRKNLSDIINYIEWKK